MPHKREVIIKDTHRGLFYEDGVLQKTLTAGRYELNIPLTPRWQRFRKRRTLQEIVLVDIRERDLTIKGQEILTADKVAIRVSIIVQYQVTDPEIAIHAVQNYEDRLYSDVQLAARRSLATMTLEEILTNRNRLNEDIMQDVSEAAKGYGVQILRANIKDIAFPGNLQDIMNRVLTAERVSQAQLVEARTRAEVARMEAENQAAIKRSQAETDAESQRIRSEADAVSQRIRTEAELQAMQERAEIAKVVAENPMLLRLLEMDTMREVGRGPNARVYLNFNDDKPDEA